MKLNVDGATKGNPGESNYGCILRDCGGDVIFGIHRFIRIDTNSVVEMMVLGRGLKICVDKHIDVVDIEGDSQLIINVIKKGSASNWRINQMMGNVSKYLGKILNDTISYIYR
ncbi:hypothetical protein SUGI_0512730 [Cryptomeria japonica]|nr:hypothetical protein SUGI_0512730 [Cryptomeria japonica]